MSYPKLARDALLGLDDWSTLQANQAAHLA